MRHESHTTGHDRYSIRGSRSASRAAAFASVVAASLLIAACGSDERELVDEPVTTPVRDPSPSTTVPPTIESTTPSPVAARYETIRMVIEEVDGPQLCFVTLESLPPQCSTGIDLEGWSWDAIDVEIVDGDTTWVDRIYVSGTYDPASDTFTVDETRLPTPDDRERILMSAPLPDHSAPCAPPADGWPERTDEFPLEQVAQLDGFAGSWSDPSDRVMVVAMTGDLTAAEASIRELYDQGLCVIAASRSADELAAIERQIRERDDTEPTSSSVWVDASDQWIQADVLIADAALQAALDAEFGEGVVRLDPQLVAIDA